MQCPKCGNLKQLTPESRRTEHEVWRRRICKGCHYSWLTQEYVSPVGKMPAEVREFTDTMRHAPRRKPKERKTGKQKKFDTSGIQQMPW